MAKRTSADETSTDEQFKVATEALANQDAQFSALDFDFDELDGKLGLERVQVDVNGYWCPELSPIFGELLGIAKAIETDLGVTGIYAIVLARPCAARTGSKQDSEIYIAQPGQVIGVFHSVGLNPLKRKAGCTVAIKRNASPQELSGGRNMWRYDIRSTPGGRALEIIDNRTPENSGAPF